MLSGGGKEVKGSYQLALLIIRIFIIKASRLTRKKETIFHIVKTMMVSRGKRTGEESFGSGLVLGTWW